VLTSSSTGSVNRVIKYRSSGRRARFINKRFQKKVAMAEGHILKYEKNANEITNTLMGQCNWFDISVGATTQVELFRDYLLNHWAGYKVLDPNTSYMSANQFRLSFKVLDHSQYFIGLNTTTVKVRISCYTCLPRHDVHSAGLLPLSAMIGYSDAARLKDVSSDAQVYTDVNVTPFMVPYITSNYNIVKSRSFTVHAGGKFVLKLRHSYDVNVGTSTQAGYSGNTDLEAKKSQYRCLLVKVVGELGSCNDDPNLFLRNMPVQIVGRLTTRANLHVSEEKRPIIFQSSTDSTRYHVGQPQIIEEEGITLANVNSLGVNIVT